MDGELIVDGAVAVENDEIIDVGLESELLQRYTGATHEDYPDCAIMPGLINCHTHLDMSLFRDFPLDPVRHPGQEVNFVNWLISCFNYKKEVSSTIQREAVTWGADECLNAGTTCIADMSSYEGIIPVLEQKGLRSVIFPEVLSINNAAAKDLFESAMAVIEKYLDGESELITVGAGPYSPYSLSRNVLKVMSGFSRNAEIPVMIHASESFSEMEFFHDSTGDIANKLFPTIGWEDLPPEHRRTPIHHLSQIGFLDASPLLVGCTQLTQNDFPHIAQTGSKVVITPRSHMNLQQGKANYKALKSNHILTVLGTDSIPSVETLSLWDEMRAFIDQHNDEICVSGYEVLSMVTNHAARALGLEEEIGSIQKGKKADLILIDMADISDDGDIIMNLIKGVTNAHIKSVMIAGRNVKSVC